jgi:hypothetical protein
MASIQNDLLDGIALLIASHGTAVYNQSGVYQPTDTAIFFKVVNPTPDRIVVLTAYQVSDDPSLPMSRLGVQVRVRGTQDPRDVDELGDAIFGYLHGLINTDFNSVHADQVLRQSSITLGQDDAKRWERADAYYIDLGTPPTNNRPSGGAW